MNLRDGACFLQTTVAILLSFCLVLSVQDVAAQSTRSITFDDIAVSPIAGDTLVWRDYLEEGILFPNRVEIVRCPISGCLRAFSGRNIARSLPINEFRKEPFVVTFTAPQREVSMQVAYQGSNWLEVQATLRAFDRDGALLARDTKRFSDDAGWTRFAIVHQDAKIARVELTGRANIEIGEDGNFLLVDNIIAIGEIEKPDPVTVPSVTISEPTDGERLDLKVNIDLTTGVPLYRQDVPLAARIKPGSASVDRVVLSVVKPDGAVIRADYCGVSQPACPSGDFPVSWSTEHSKPGRYELTLRAEATDGGVGSHTVHFFLDAKERPPVDLWAMGIEYNQIVQQIVHTDLLREPGAEGFVPVYCEPECVDSRNSIPIVRNRPMVVRVYVGLREGRELMDRDVRATGYITVGTNQVGDSPVRIEPLANTDCTDFDRTATDQACLSEIDVPPPLGEVELTAPSGERFPVNTWGEYDLDLLGRRTSLSKTLNFVVPVPLVNELAAAGSGIIRATIWPTNGTETERGDNHFSLQLTSFSRPNPLVVNLVRIETDLEPAVTSGFAQQALEDMLRFTRFDNLFITHDQTFFFDETDPAPPLLTTLLGVPIPIGDLEVRENLWIRLFDAFPLSQNETVVALTPPGWSHRSIAWRVPDLESSIRAPVEYLGGIAVVRSPDPADAGSRERRLFTMAHEIYHAVFDQRHIDSGNGEDDGCFLGEGIGADIIDFFTAIDPACAHPPLFPIDGLGASAQIGRVPMLITEIGRPGTTTHGYFSGRLIGHRGGMGISIEPDASSAGVVLRLVDPCPVGAFDFFNPESAILERVTIDNEGVLSATCSLPLPQQIFDFMTYRGNQRWTSPATFYWVQPLRYFFEQ